MSVADLLLAFTVLVVVSDTGTQFQKILLGQTLIPIVQSVLSYKFNKCRKQAYPLTATLNRPKLRPWPDM